MIDLTPRGSVYANHPEFDSLQLRHVRTFESRIRGVTLDGWVVEVVNKEITCDFGKPDRSKADPDALIAPEVDAVPTQPKMQAKTRALMARLQELLREKPRTSREMAAAADVTMHRVQCLIQSYPNDFPVVERIGHGLKTFVYGPAGGDDNGDSGE